MGTRQVTGTGLSSADVFKVVAIQGTCDGGTQPPEIIFGPVSTSGSTQDSFSVLSSIAFSPLYLCVQFGGFGPILATLGTVVVSGVCFSDTCASSQPALMRLWCPGPRGFSPTQITTGVLSTISVRASPSQLLLPTDRV